MFFFLFRRSPFLSLQTTVIAYMQQTSQNHRFVWVGDAEGFPENIPMFAMTSTHMLFLVTRIAEVSTVKLKFEMWKFKSDPLPNSPRHLGSQESLTSWLEIRCQKAECHDMCGVIHQVPSRFNEPSQLRNFHTSGLNNENSKNEEKTSFLQIKCGSRV